jgi:hypothetical protein
MMAMNSTLKSTSALVLLTLLTQAGMTEEAVKVWTDRDLAAKEAPGFDLIGDYMLDGKAIQVTLQSDQYFVTKWPGALLSDASKPGSAEMTVTSMDDVKSLLAKAEKVERVSPTLGAQAPEGAVFPFGKDSFTHGNKTEDSYGSFHMHLEFILPLKPDRSLSNQDRGNSGVYIYNIYECQILDTYPLDYHAESYPIEKLGSNSDRWCASLYKTKIADANAGLPPLTWQTYDIDFTAPVFDGDKKVKNARLSLKWNGVLVHDDVELEKGTGMGSRRQEVPKGPILVQDHGNPVMFRNTWLVEK